MALCPKTIRILTGLNNYPLSKCGIGPCHDQRRRNHGSSNRGLLGPPYQRNQRGGNTRLQADLRLFRGLLNNGENIQDHGRTNGPLQRIFSPIHDSHHIPPEPICDAKRKGKPAHHKVRRSSYQLGGVDGREHLLRTRG